MFLKLELLMQFLASNYEKMYLIINNKHLFLFNLFKPWFTIVIFIHYKPRIAVAILDL